MYLKTNIFILSTISVLSFVDIIYSIAVLFAVDWSYLIRLCIHKEVKDKKKN